ncbi:MAG TPA: HigA family addiction module antitoxin [Planctomycetaceae bacterium]|nr:HigA family addiction module antitoxin [Planctomycetaceae bacterium]
MMWQRAAEVFPPGEFIKDEIESRGWSRAQLAKIMGCSASEGNEIIAAKKAITLDTAQVLRDAFGTGTQFWLNLENTYRLSTRSTEDSGDAS